MNKLSLSLPSRLAFGALCAAATVFGSGCSASADIPEVVVTQSDIEFAGVPHIPGLALQNTLSTSFDHPEDVSLPEDLHPELHPLFATITGRDDTADLSFIQELTLTISSRSQGAPPPHVVATYAKGSAAPSRVVQLKIDGASDVLSYWKTKKAFYDVTISGELPEQDWAIDVSVGFAGHLSVSAN